MQRRSQEFPVPRMHRLDGPLVAGWVVGFVLSGEIIREAVGSPDPHPLDRQGHIRSPESDGLAELEVGDQPGHAPVVELAAADLGGRPGPARSLVSGWRQKIPGHSIMPVKGLAPFTWMLWQPYSVPQAADLM